MKKTRILAIVLSLCMLLALVPVAALAAEFTDADEVSNASFAGAIDRWADEGVISGNPDGSFDPKGTMSRVQGFGIIAELLNLTEKADLSEYTDVPADGWKADYLAKVVAAGIVTGYPDKTLRPEGELTREQMFVTIAKTLGIQPVETDDEEFEDIGEATSYAAPYINALHKMGAVNGSNGNVNPLDTLSREGAALLLDNLIGGYANEDGDTATIEEGKITLVVADNVKVEGTANDQPIVVAGQASTVDMEGVEGTPTVNVTVPEVKIENAPVGTTVTVAEDVTDVTVNDETVEAGGEVVVPEPTPTPTPTPTPIPQPTTYAIAHKIVKEDTTTAGNDILTFAITNNVTTAEANDTVEFTVTVTKANWGIKNIYVTGTGTTKTNVELSGGNGKYHFVMPAEAVTITVVVREDPQGNCNFGPDGNCTYPTYNCTYDNTGDKADGYGGAEPSEEETQPYTITYDLGNATGGLEFETDNKPASSAAGKEVKFVVKVKAVESGNPWRITNIYVDYDGGTCTLHGEGGTYDFTMPHANVTVHIVAQQAADGNCQYGPDGNCTYPKYNCQYDNTGNPEGGYSGVDTSVPGEQGPEA